MSNSSQKENMYRILVVDDHRFVHDIISKILGTVNDMTIMGHASNGLEAIQFCQSSEPDVILMDVVMPIMDGLEAVSTIHAKFPKIKILSFSTFKTTKVSILC